MSEKSFYGTPPAVTPAGTQPGARPYLHTMEAGARLPLLQSVIWGVVAGLLALIAVCSGRPMWPDDLLWPAGAAVAGFALAWMGYQRHWFKLSSLERLTGLDINGDGRIGQQVRNVPLRVVPVQVNEIDANGHFHVRKQFNLPASEEQLEQLAYGLLRLNRPLTFREWTGKGKPFSDNEFEALRSEMIKRGLVTNSGAEARRGLVLTETGRATMEKFLEE